MLKIFKILNKLARFYMKMERIDELLNISDGTPSTPIIDKVNLKFVDSFKYPK